jgi:hypothetical protein
MEAAGAPCDGQPRILELRAGGVWGKGHAGKGRFTDVSVRAQHAIVLAGLALASLVLACAAAAGTGKDAVRFSRFTARVIQGKEASVEVAVRRAGSRCALTVRYANGSRQRGLSAARPQAGRVSWQWRIPAEAAIGHARVSVACPGAGTVSRDLVVVGGDDTDAKVAVASKGFSQKTREGRGQSEISYGLLLANTSRAKDALEVNVLINFLDANRRIVASKTDRIGAIGAGSTYALGGSMYLGAFTVEHLEVVVRVGKSVPRSIAYPAIREVSVGPSLVDPAFVGGVYGEIVNVHRSLTLERARISVILLDSAGAVLGGGTGYASAELPPGARVLFKVTTGITPVRIDRVASVRVSTEPSYASS